MIKVLVVEDEPKIADMERDFLEGSGYQPYVASDGKEALKIMDEVEIDAIILDVMLPGEDGFSLCRKMRERTNAPIISPPPALKTLTSSEVSVSARMTTS